MKTMQRGLRNNNPLNIRHNPDRFKGEVFPSGDRSFKQFRDMDYGYRAAFRMLRTYQLKYGCEVLSDFISRWAPDIENDTKAYIYTVCKRTGLSADSPVDTMSEVQMRRIVAAMSFVENGVEADEEQVRRGWNLYINS